MHDCPKFATTIRRLGYVICPQPYEYENTLFYIFNVKRLARFLRVTAYVHALISDTHDNKINKNKILKALILNRKKWIIWFNI